MSDEKKHLIIFTSADGKISINAHFDAESAWLSLDQVAELFEEGELEQSATVAKIATVQTAVNYSPIKGVFQSSKPLKRLNRNLKHIVPGRCGSWKAISTRR